MGKYDDIGKLMHLPLADIEPGEPFSESEFILAAAAEAVRQSGERNWIPAIVKETGDYQYQVVSNHFVYAVAQQANLERIWCIVIEPDEKSIEQAKILAREVTPKVNLNTASRDTILAALRYLIAEPGSALKGVDSVVAADRIAAAKGRETWSKFDSVTSLKCGLTKGKKLEAIGKVFFLQPAPLPPPPPAPPEVISVKRASREEIFTRLSYLSTHKIGGFEAVEPEKAADAIFTANKAKWKSLNPITKLECGIDKAQQLKTLKIVLSL